MPKGEIEKHPFLTRGNTKCATKLLLGSFPVYECTEPDNCYKEKKRGIEGTTWFFYGSNRNRLWSKYKEFIDCSISEPWDADIIIESLKNRNIAISDVIIKCERYSNEKNKNTGEEYISQFSSEDSALHNKEWNSGILVELLNGGVSKILCTSKGVLENLEKQIICKRNSSIGIVNNKQTKIFQTEFLKDLGGDYNTIKKPICNVFAFNEKEIVALAIPSPGSPQRKIKDFGCESEDKMEYANKYFKKAFEWFIE